MSRTLARSSTATRRSRSFALYLRALSFSASKVCGLIREAGVGKRGCGGIVRTNLCMGGVWECGMLDVIDGEAVHEYVAVIE